MSGGETRDREAGAAIDGQPADNDPAATPCLSDGHGRKIRMAAIQDDDPTPRGRDDPVDRRREGDGQLSQRRVADVDAGAPAAKAKAIKS
jgi:hypothetical protein